METGTNKPEFENKGVKNEQIESLLQSIDLIKENLESKEKEIDDLRAELHKPKRWWKDFSNIISITALLISLIVTVHSCRKEGQKEIADQKLRVKEIVKRLSEIQVLYATAGNQLGSIYQSTSAEVSNLIDEAVAISRQNVNYLNDAEYLTIISMSMLNNKTENLEELIDNALKTVHSFSTEFGIRNYQSKYYFLIKGQPEKGRSIIKDVIHKTESDPLDPVSKRLDIAQEYESWCQLEFQTGNYKKTDSILTIAENLVVNGRDSFKYMNSPVTQQIKYDREYLTNFKKKRLSGD